ncbi:DUF1642 domain-containing protein [Streptococcus suis]|uniref:DUF1642 domain-containing protein n=1 Tax=Streptococcus suis TaxID=1307 RepID=UPI00137B00EC|nr:DUF1642 domain-containing protein [Streptococcus suis]
MNKQEAIGIIEQSKIKKANTERVIFKAGEIVGECVQVDYVPLEVVVNTINQIYEPQKVVVPKFVAEWYERNKDGLDTAIYSTITGTYRKVNGENDDLLDKFEGWLVYEVDSILTLVKMHLFGYEVEQEQLFTVRIPDPNRPDTVTFLYKENGKVFIGSDIFLDEVPNYKWKKEPENQLTEVEIKKDFEWAWDAGFAKEVE